MQPEFCKASPDASPLISPARETLHVGVRTSTANEEDQEASSCLGWKDTTLSEIQLLRKLLETRFDHTVAQIVKCDCEQVAEVQVEALHVMAVKDILNFNDGEKAAQIILRAAPDLTTAVEDDEYRSRSEASL